jgi:hypothetical protein
MRDILDPTAWAMLFLLLSVLVFAALTILRRRRESDIQMREIPPFQDLWDELGRAAESGKPLHIALGNGGLGSGNTVSSLAGLQVLEGLVDAAVSYDVPPIVTVGDATLLPLAQDVLRRAYARGQIAEFYDPSQVRFVAPSPVAYAAGAVPVGAPEDVTANVAVGAFGSEVSLVADMSDRRRTSEAGAVDTAEAIGALYPATDRLAMGEELYAAGAQITEEKKYTTGLIAQDVLRFVLALVILASAALSFLGG